ncbi:MAG: hypothetical protein HZA54_01910 [Planctomycetes bacterium]|nr:hypothetical protein [Planctomycetota bacterium]
MSQDRHSPAHSARTALDLALPLLIPEQAELHRNCALLEVDEPARLVRIARDARLGRYLLGRLSDTVALVDPGGADALAAALLAAGYTPKRVVGEGRR